MDTPTLCDATKEDRRTPPVEIDNKNNTTPEAVGGLSQMNESFLLNLEVCGSTQAISIAKTRPSYFNEIKSKAAAVFEADATGESSLTW